ncbi:DUF616 domain-containing protein [Brucella anthropi]|nr:DUF616 domain-containing protein [Brucella anthropi]
MGLLKMIQKIKNHIKYLRSATSYFWNWRDARIVKKSDMFDESWYLEQNPDVRDAFINAARHYVRHGAYEGRDPSPSFNSLSYLASNSDVKNAGLNPLVHYIQHGKKEGRNILPSKFEAVIAFQQPVASQQPYDSTVDEEYNLISGSDLWNEEWYQYTYKASLASHEDPLLHFITKGWRLGFNPSLSFWTKEYLDYYRDVKAVGVNPIYHYLTNGKNEGRNPTPKKRLNKSPFTRLTPDEVGNPDIVLLYDAPVGKVQNIDQEKIAVHVHLYHMDMRDDILHYLTHIEQNFTLLISIQQGENPDDVKVFFTNALPYCNNIIVKECVNRGRDVAPWTIWFRDEILESTIFLHIHSKKSTHNKSHRGQFRYLSHVTLGAPTTVNQILSAFCSDPQIGIIAPCYHWSSANQPNYGRNVEVCKSLFSRLSKGELPGISSDYPAGSFFWARTATLKPLFNLNLTIDDFDEEAGQVDGTFAHAIEHMMGLLPALTGMTYKKATVDVAYDLIRYFGKDRVAAPQQVWQSRFPPVKKSYHTKASKIAVYSCISGGYENAIPLIADDSSIDKFLVVDNDEFIVPDGYTKIFSNYVHPISVRTARFAKTHPHIWLADYDFVFWIDSNIHFLGDLRNYAEVLKQNDAECGFILHPARDNFLEEANILAADRIIDTELSRTQISRYLNIPGLINQPMFETGFMVSRPKHDRVKNFMGTWWSEINRFTHRDQLSVNYAAYSTGLKWTNLLDPGRSARDHADFILFSHNNTARDAILNEIKTSK